MNRLLNSVLSLPRILRRTPFDQSPSAMAGQFRSSVWDPILIVAQITTMQSIFYMSLGCWVCVLDFIMGNNRSLGQLFGYDTTQFKDIQGRFVMFAYLCNALCGALGLWYIVQRTKQCWDFAATAHILHLIGCWVYNGWFPNSLSWWLITLISVIMMTVLGEFMCMRTELKAIPLNVGPKADL